MGKFILFSIDNLVWEADAYEFDSFFEARDIMKERFDRDIQIAMEKMGVECPDHPDYCAYPSYFKVVETLTSLHVEFVHDPFTDDIYHYEIRQAEKWEPDDGSVWVRGEDGLFYKEE